MNTRVPLSEMTYIDATPVSNAPSYHEEEEEDEGTREYIVRVERVARYTRTEYESVVVEAANEEAAEDYVLREYCGSDLHDWEASNDSYEFDEADEFTVYEVEEWD